MTQTEMFNAKFTNVFLLDDWQNGVHLDTMGNVYRSMYNLTENLQSNSNLLGKAVTRFIRF